MTTTSVTQYSYPGSFAASFTPFTIGAPAGWSRVWLPRTLGVLDASGAPGIPDSPLRPNLVVEASRVPADLGLEEIARQIFDGMLVENPGLGLEDEVVGRLGDRVAVRRRQTIPVDEQSAVRQILVLSVAPMAGVPENEFFQLTASFDAAHAEQLERIFDDVIASFRFEGQVAP